MTETTYRARASLQIEGFNNDQFMREINPISSLPNSTPENYLQNEVKLLGSETLPKREAANPIVAKIMARIRKAPICRIRDSGRRRRAPNNPEMQASASTERPGKLFLQNDAARHAET